MYKYRIPVIGVVSQVTKNNGILQPYLDISIMNMLEYIGINWVILPPIKQSLKFDLDGYIVCGTNISIKDYYNINNTKIKNIMSSLPECDLFEIELFNKLRENNVPTLGICHGMQLMNISAHGDIDYVERHNIDDYHDIFLTDKFKDYLKIDLSTQKVNSKHNLACKNIGEGLLIGAISNVPEIIYDPECNFYVGLQWHPEFLLEEPLTKMLLKRFTSNVLI